MQRMNTGGEPVQTLKRSELRYRRLFEAAQDGILILDAKTGAITDVNPFLINLLGYSREEFMDKRLWEVGAFKDIKASKEAFQALQENEYIRYKDLPLRAVDGKLIQVEFVSNVYKEGKEKVIQCNIRDITERKQAQDALIKSKERLREQSVRDHLTGLFNRRYLEETLQREILRAARKRTSIGVIMMDVDNFKQINDIHGHPAGDTILQKLGDFLLSNVRGDDIAARYGGDEFMVVLPNASRKITYERAELLRESVSKFQILIDEKMLESISVTMGVANYPDDGKTVEAILRASDDAFYQAKKAGSNRVVLANSNGLLQEYDMDQGTTAIQ